MPHVIFKCPYIKGGARRAASHLSNYVRYMATREGAQHVAPSSAQLPATEKQRAMVEQLIRDFPLSRGMFEYEAYLAAPTRGNASEFITRALEDNYDQTAKKENYVSYIASRPRAQRAGDHALFTASDDPLVLARIADEVAHHPRNVWLPIISLRREDAARLGYDNAEKWKQLMTGYAMEMAEAMKIPWEQFRWYASFHDEAHHPHLHMVCYSQDGKSGFLTKDGIARIKSGLAKEIFQQELHELYQRQTQRRETLTQEAGAVMVELIRQMQTGTLDSPRMEQLMNEAQKAEDRMEKIISAIQTDDKQVLKSLFSKKAMDESDDLDDEIASLFDFVQGEVDSWEIGIWASDESIEYGKRTLMIRPEFKVVTNVEEYSFFLIDYTIDTINPNNEGIYMLEVSKLSYSGEWESWEDRMHAGISIVE